MDPAGGSRPLGELLSKLSPICLPNSVGFQTALYRFPLRAAFTLRLRSLEILGQAEAPSADPKRLGRFVAVVWDFIFLIRVVD